MITITAELVDRYVRACLDRWPEEDSFREWALEWLEGKHEFGRLQELLDYLERDEVKPSKIVDGYRQGPLKGVAYRNVIMLAITLWFEPSEVLETERDIRGVLRELDTWMFARTSVAGAELQ